MRPLDLGLRTEELIARFEMFRSLGETEIKALVQRLHLYLEPGGYLFLGQGDKLPAIDLAFQPKTCDHYVLYRKPMATAARVGRRATPGPW